jgi:hypothetical protein
VVSGEELRLRVLLGGFFDVREDEAENAEARLRFGEAGHVGYAARDGDDDVRDFVGPNGFDGVAAVDEEDGEPPTRTVVADGRHRLFAVLDVAEKFGPRDALVLFGERRP